MSSEPVEAAPDDLAARTFSPLTQEARGAEDAAQAQEAADAAQAAASMQIIERGAKALMLGLLKIARAAIARKLPEIREEWTDEALAAPTEAAVPLLRRHLEGLMQIIGQNVELAAFAIACVPLGMGYLAAVERHARTVDVEAKPASEPAPDGGIDAAP